MEIKKYEKLRLENYTGLFFQLGLALSLSIIYFSLEHKVNERSIGELMEINNQTEIIEDIPITERIQAVKPPPPPPAPEKIEIVENQEDIIETALESTETDQSQEIVITKIEDIEEAEEAEVVEEDIPFVKIEEPPIYPGCTGTKAQKRKCFGEKVKEHVSKNYNGDLTEELGLGPGIKRIFVQFKINKSGNIENIRARGPHVRLEKEATRIVKLLPKMTPGKQRGRPTSVRYLLPIAVKVIE